MEALLFAVENVAAAMNERPPGREPG